MFTSVCFISFVIFNVHIIERNSERKRGIHTHTERWNETLEINKWTQFKHNQNVEAQRWKVEVKHNHKHIHVNRNIQAIIVFACRAAYFFWPFQMDHHISIIEKSKWSEFEIRNGREGLATLSITWRIYLASNFRLIWFFPSLLISFFFKVEWLILVMKIFVTPFPILRHHMKQAKSHKNCAPSQMN